MNTKSRTINSMRNILFGLLGQIVNLLVSFVSRTIFINQLGVKFLGINGLFTNILSMLSLTELGIGTAIIYSLYKPLADKNISEICGLMNLYAKAYRIIAILIGILGLMVVPFLDLLIKENTHIQFIKYIYLMFLTNSVLSYLFSYKRSIIYADQKNYINTIFQNIFSLSRTTTQIVLLIFYKSFIAYLAIQILFTFLENFFISRKADKFYPFLKNGKNQTLSREKKKELFENISSIFTFSIFGVVLNGTDNIIISSFVGVASVGLVANYNLIISSINMIVGQFFNSLTSSLGNLNNTKEEEERREFILSSLNLVCFWIYGLCSICLWTLCNPFISLWLGKKYLLSELVLFILVINFYMPGAQTGIYLFRTTMGIFKPAKYVSLASAMINILLSLLFVQKLGVLGVFLGTAISRLFTFTFFDPYFVFKYGLKKSVFPFYIKYFCFFALIIVSGAITSYFGNLIHVDNYVDLIVVTGISIIIPNIIFLIFFFNTKEFNYILKSLRNFYNKIFYKLNNYKEVVSK